MWYYYDNALKKAVLYFVAFVIIVLWFMVVIANENQTKEQDELVFPTSLDEKSDYTIKGTVKGKNTDFMPICIDVIS